MAEKRRVLRKDETPRVRVLIAQVEHTAQLAIQDGSQVTGSKLRAHLLQFAEAKDTEPEASRWPESVWVLSKGPEDRVFSAHVPEPIPDTGQTVRRYIPAPEGSDQ